MKIKKIPTIALFLTLIFPTVSLADHSIEQCTPDGCTCSSDSAFCVTSDCEEATHLKAAAEEEYNQYLQAYYTIYDAAMDALYDCYAYADEESCIIGHNSFEKANYIRELVNGELRDNYLAAQKEYKAECF